MNLEQLRIIVSRHRITYGVMLAILIASLLTMASMALYVSSGASRLDLSRPGYERARTEITSDSGPTTFSATGNIGTAVLADFQKRYTVQRQSIDSLGAFNSAALDDTELGIAPPTE